MKDLDILPEYITKKIKEIIKEESGIIINDDREIDFEIVIRGRIINNKVNPADYIDLLKSNDNEIITVASFFTIQESSFYRNKNHFDRLRNHIFPAIRFEKEKQNNRNIRILSAGCATGEEPYTIAMIFNDLFTGSSQWNIEIIATDINKKALEFAKEGVYSEYKLRNIEDYYKSRYYDIIKKDKITTYKVKEDIKKYIKFKQCNLIKEPFVLNDLNNVDIIFCENVIIYFCQESVQRLINNFYNILGENGYLFLGYSETLNMIKHNFNLSWWNDSFAYQKNENARQKENSVNITGFTDKIEEIKNDGINIISYKDFIFLAVQNYKKGLIENVSTILEEMEKRKVELKEDFYIIKAEFLCDKEDYMNAANLCRNVISMNPYNIDAHLILCNIYIQIGMYEKAEFEIKTALYIDENSILAHYFYAIYYYQIKNIPVSLDYLKKAYEISMKKGTMFEDILYPINENKRNSIRNRILSYHEQNFSEIFK